MTRSADLLAELMRSAPFQPATNLWRAVGLDALLRHGLPQGRGLDLGCGDGQLTGIVCRALDPTGRQRHWVGVDIDAEETAQAAASGLYHRVHTASAAAIPEPDGSFDFVFSNSVLEHIPPIHEVLKEAARLLRRGGRCVFTVPGPDFHACLAGQRARPIEIQRRLRMRSAKVGVVGLAAAAMSPLLMAGVALDADVAAPRYGCLLLDATKSAR